MRHIILIAVLMPALLIPAAYADDKGGVSHQPAAGQPATGNTWKEPVTGMEFVHIPPGCFKMGGDGQGPVHKVCLKGFYLGKYEVTQAQYQAMGGVNQSQLPGDNFPAETVSFTGVSNLIGKFNEHNHTKLRLPSEAEWEYACRAGGKHSEYCGEGSADELAWYGEKNETGNHPVGMKRPNAWGLYDMSGNAGEYVQDYCSSSYRGAPVDGSARSKPGNGPVGSYRVVRGGSYISDQNSIRATFNACTPPTARGVDVGFRLAITSP